MIIKTYRELNKIITAFKTGKFDLLIIKGEGGLGKTFNANRILNGDVLKFNSHLTALEMYIQGYENKNKKIWFDDVENLFNNDKLMGLLKQFCETLPKKEIQYSTSWNLNKTRKVPKKFKTSAKVLMTVNNIPRKDNAGIKALLDRGIVIDFCPDSTEKLNYIQKKIKGYDKEVIDYIKKIDCFSLRDFIKANQLKKAKFDWWRDIFKEKNGTLQMLKM